MTFNLTDHVNQPHVVVVSTEPTDIRPCYASTNRRGISNTWAIYATRDEADAAIVDWKPGDVKHARYFSIPASVLFDIETETVTITKFTRR